MLWQQQMAVVGHLLKKKHDGLRRTDCAKTTFHISFKQKKNEKKTKKTEHQIYITLDSFVIFFMFSLQFFHPHHNTLFHISVYASLSLFFQLYFSGCVYSYFFSFFLSLSVATFKFIQFGATHTHTHTVDSIQNIKEENESVGEQKGNEYKKKQ